MAEQSLAYKKAKSLVDEWKKLGMTIDKDEEYIISDIQLNLIAVHMDTVKVFSGSNDELLEALEMCLAEMTYGDAIWTTDWKTVVEKARQAIVKAKGE